MPESIKRVFKPLALLLSGVVFFLSCWIVLPAPTYFLLILGIAAPEVSPWLLVLNAIATLLVLVNFRPNRLQYLTLVITLTGILLSALPLLQLPATERRMAVAMESALGADYIAQIPKDASQMGDAYGTRKARSQPFVLADAFTGIDHGKCRYTQGIQFAKPDGVPLSMNIYQPPQVGKYPALVVIYGGAWQNGNPAKDAQFNRYMAEHGYTVFAIDYRHAPDYRFPAQLDDVRTAITFIRQHATEYEADPERLALLGRSSGAHLAMLAAYQPDAPLIRAVVNYYGPVNLTEGYADPPRPDPLNIRALLKAFLGGSPDELPQQYSVASPINYVNPQLPPTLLVYGSRDHVVQARFGQQMYERLRNVGSTAILLQIPWAEHAFDAIFNGVSNQLSLYYTERFLAWALR